MERLSPNGATRTSPGSKACGAAQKRVVKTVSGAPRTSLGSKAHGAARKRVV